MKLNSLRNAELEGKTVFLRLDLNVPIKDGVIQDDTRIKAAVPTLQHILKTTHKVVVASHLGRPKGAPDKEFSLAPVAERLTELVGFDVVFVDDYAQEPADQILRQLGKNQFIVLENLRFHPGETENSSEFAEILMKGVQIYVDDAFGAVHRAHASIVAAAEQVPLERRFAGFLIEQEIIGLDRLKNRPEVPFTAIIGGAKVSDKIGVILNLLNHCSHMIFGGAMAYTFLKFQGHEVGNSRVEADKLDLVERIFERAQARNVAIHLPVDHLCAEAFSADAPVRQIDQVDIPNGLMGLDIGPRTIQSFKDTVALSKTILWNGPMGVFEWPKFSRGTTAIAQEIARTKAYSVVGGGDSVAAVNMAGVADKITHISTGGGASLEYLEGLILPGLKVLR